MEEHDQTRAGRPSRMRRWIPLGIGVLGLAGFLIADPLGILKTMGSGQANAADEASTAVQPESKEKAAAEPIPSDLGLLKTLEARKKSLDDREQELARQEARLKSAKTELSQDMESMKKLRDEITAAFQQDKQVQDERLDRMISTICINMKPDQAAQILSRMDNELVLKMISKLDDKRLSKILEKMDRELAARLSADFLRQKRDLPSL